MNHISLRIAIVLFVSAAAMQVFAVAEDTTKGVVPENLYTAQAVSYPGPWAFQLGRSGIIYIEDQQLDDLTDPDKQVDLGITGTPNVTTLRAICENAKAAGH
ncbi:MAG: hypothetical protein IT367_04485, partial [Candidatus Hydrogenedentes bacterium]|nr:hypothetical protein [Candidatus Hydrogenedentota bacterium]